MPVTVRPSSAVPESSEAQSWVGFPGIAGVAHSVGQLSCNQSMPVSSCDR